VNRGARTGAGNGATRGAVNDVAAPLALMPVPSGPLVVPAAVPGAEPALRLSLVIPTRNEAVNLGPLIDGLEALLEPVLGEAYELIVVDDDSADGTWQVALGLARTHPRLRVVRRTTERGLATAVIRGWQVARGEVLAVMDADLQHPVATSLALLAEMERGADLAVASRNAEGGGVSDWSVRRRILSRGAQLLGLLVLPGVLGKVSDPMSGYFMVRRSALAGITLTPLGYKILVEVLARGRLRWLAEVGYVFRERSEGESKVTLGIYFQYLLHLIRLRWATLPQSKLFRFCVVGASGVVVDMSMLFLLSDPTMLGFGLTRSKIAAAEVAIVNNFLWNDAWTFRDAARSEPGARAKFRRFLGYNAICIAGVALNVVILNLLFNFAGINRYVANAIAIVAVTAWNYGVNKRLNWSAKS
jgi:dolichol-phosphate mannosyltransferase